MLTTDLFSGSFAVAFKYTLGVPSPDKRALYSVLLGFLTTNIVSFVPLVSPWPCVLTHVQLVHACRRLGCLFQEHSVTQKRRIRKRKISASSFLGRWNSSPRS